MTNNGNMCSMGQILDDQALSQRLCKPPNWCKIKLHSMESIFMARKKESPQEAEMSEMMGRFLFTQITLQK